MELTALKDLETLYLLCDRFSHELRTPLGVALGVLDDHLQGQPLSREDYEDAQTSLKNIHRSLEHVREIGAALSPTFRRVGSVELIEELSCSLVSSPKLKVSEDADLILVADLKLLVRALRSLERYLLFRADKTIERSLPQFVIETSARGVCLSAELKLSSGEVARFSKLQTIKEIVICDHSVVALNLLFVDAACRLLGVGLSVGCEAERGIYFELMMPVVTEEFSAISQTVAPEARL